MKLGFMLALLLLPMASRGLEAKTCDWGFFFSRDAERTTSIGPIVERCGTTNSYVRSVRPFVSQWKNQTRMAEQVEVFWPLYERWHFGEESNWRALLVFSGKQFDVAADQGRYRSWFMPFYFQGRNVDGAEYHAVFPLGGTLYDFLGRDKITFALFPAWCQSNMEEQHTTSVLWPIYSRTVGPRDNRHRVFPLYGYSTRKDQWHKQFACWPLWTQSRYFGKREGASWMLFPVCGHGQVGDEETTYVLPPLFRVTRSPKQSVTNVPWPFLQFASGEIDKAYVWPVYGQKESEGAIRRFALWPLIWQQQTEKAEGVQRRLDVVPVWSSDSITADDGAQLERYWKLWPLMSYRRQGDEKRFRMLELWPQKQCGPVERNWQPFLTVFDHQANADGFEQELLWGLYRNRKEGESKHLSLFPLYENDRKKDGKRWKILKGLLGHTRDEESSQWQFLYFIKTEKEVKP